MPTFDFLCQKCGYVFEYTRAFGSSDLPACPECGSKKTEKQIVPPAIQFRGEGFYKTDSRTVVGKPKKETVDTPTAPPKESEAPKPAKDPAPEAPKKSPKSEKP